MIEWRALRVKPGRCPSCGPTLFIKLANNALAVRCLRCKASAIHMSLIAVLKERAGNLGNKHVYELSARGPMVAYLKSSSGRLTCSEFIDGVAPGDFLDGIQCQNVEKLTYDDASFDICTSTEVLEHVADDRMGFREIQRVLKPGGLFVFTVPIPREDHTVERAVMEQGVVRHILPPEYHSDRLRGQDQVLVFRDYGPDITDRLTQSGFKDATIVIPHQIPWDYGVAVVFARK